MATPGRAWAEDEAADQQAELRQGVPSPDQVDGASALAQKLSNPLANLISVPLANNFDFKVGPDDGWRLTSQFQPVIPISLNENWNVISRTIVPVIYQNDVAGQSGSQFGLGDTVQSFFVSPQNTPVTSLGRLTWGVGPIITLPTSTHDRLGAGEWGLGPTGVILFQTKHWTYGALASHTWSVGNAKISASYLQPFVSYSAQGGVSYAVSSELTYNWHSDDLTGPINVGVSKVTTLGQQPISLGAKLRWWAFDKPYTPQGLGFALSLTFIFPK